MKFIALILAISLVSCATRPDVKRPENKPVSVGNVAVSSLIPGLPQLLTGQAKKAVIVAAIMIPGLLGVQASTNEEGDVLPGKEALAAASYIAFGGAFGYSLYDGVRYSMEINRQWAGMFPIGIGMTDYQLIKAKGKPTSINRTITAGTIHEQWVYRKGDTYDADYYYFENGVLTTIQN